MRTTEHQQHIDQRVSYNDCQECRADCERQFLRPQWNGYQFVSKYLGYVKPRLAAIREGELSADARHWQRKFRDALNRRITLKGAGEVGRKQNDGYHDRLRGTRFAGSNADSAYLRRLARKGASALR